MLADAVVYSVEGDTYCWRDVILSAVRRGDWRAVEQRARLGAACVRHADHAGTALPTSSLDAAACDFRYARDLVTAQSMEEWLARRDIQAQEWSAFLRQEVHRKHTTESPATLLGRYPVSEQDASRLALVEAVCGPDLDNWARRLARQSAAHAALATVPPTEPVVEHDGSAATSHPIPMTVVGTDDVLIRASMQRLAVLDESLSAFRAMTVTHKAVQDYVSGRQLDWVRFDCRILAFPREDMAAEAALLLREDGEGFTSVYQVAHTDPRTEQFFLDDINESLRTRFLGARTGDLIGPVRVGAEYVLYEIERKVLPSMQEASVTQRAEDAVLDLALDQQVQRRVTWNRGG